MKSLDELRKIRDEVRQSLALRSGGQRTRILVGMGTCGIAAGARDTMRAFLDAVEAENLDGIAITATGCAGFCEQEPCVDVEMEDREPVHYGKVDPAAARRIVSEHIKSGTPVQELVR